MKKKLKINYSSILTIIFIIVSVYLIHSILLFDQIENFKRYVLIGIIIIADLFILWKLFFGKKKKKKKFIYTTIIVLCTLLYGYVGANLNEIYSLFNFNKDVVISTSIVTLKENILLDKDGSLDLNKVKDTKIGISEEGNGKELSKEILDKYKLEDSEKKIEIVSFESYTEAINALYEKEVEYIFLPTNFVDVFGTREGYEDIGEKIAIIDSSKSVTTKEEVQLSGDKDITEPFTILLIGIDSTVDGLQNADSFNGDSLIVVTFNPKTMNATMLSIPRDSYVPITCMNNVDNKITHSAASGTKCVINTIQNFLDIKIDYFMKINFTGVVDLVDALGGVDVDVEYSFCEQNSQRKFGQYTQYVKAGFQTLNGEEALAYSRNRKNNAELCSSEWTQGVRDDFQRSAHQQVVIQAILDKMKEFTSINDLKKILEVVSNNTDTNMSESTIFSFYNIAKDVLISSSSDAVLTIEKLYLDGTGQMIYDERSKLVLWDYILNQNSLAAVKKAMKDNLNGTKKELIKTFSFSIDEEYEPTVIGKGYSGTQTYKLLTNMVGMKLANAQTWANNNGVTLKIEYVKKSGTADDTVVSQDFPEKKRIDLIPNKTVTIEVVKNSGDTTPTSTKIDCLKDTTNSICKVPNFVGKSKSNVEAWKNSISNNIEVAYEKEKSTEIDGLILKQSVAKDTSVKDLLEKNNGKIIITRSEHVESTDNGGGSNDNNGDNQGGGSSQGGTTSDDNGGSGQGEGSQNNGGDSQQPDEKENG